MLPGFAAHGPQSRVCTGPKQPTTASGGHAGSIKPSECCCMLQGTLIYRFNIAAELAFCQSSFSLARCLCARHIFALGFARLEVQCQCNMPRLHALLCFSAVSADHFLRLTHSLFILSALCMQYSTNTGWSLLRRRPS